MKRLLLLIAILALGGLMAWAQTNTQSNTTNGTSATSNQTSTANTSNSADTGATANTQTSGTAATSNPGTATGAHARKGQKNGRLPQTASPLPFLGMIGFGSMAAGMVMRKIRK